MMTMMGRMMMLLMMMLRMVIVLVFLLVSVGVGARSHSWFRKDKEQLIHIRMFDFRHWARLATYLHITYDIRLGEHALKAKVIDELTRIIKAGTREFKVLLYIDLSGPVENVRTLVVDFEYNDVADIDGNIWES